MIRNLSSASYGPNTEEPFHFKKEFSVVQVFCIIFPTARKQKFCDKEKRKKKVQRKTPKEKTLDAVH